MIRVLLALLLVAPGAARAADPTKEDLLRFEKQLKAAHANVGPAIACIVVSRSDKYPKPDSPVEPWRLGRFDRTAFLKANPKQAALAEYLDLSSTETIPDHGFAGGVVIDRAGLVLTNFHTIDGATKIYVHLPGLGGSYADIRAADGRSDLAVLKLIDPPTGMKAVRFGRVRLPTSANDPTATIEDGQLGLLMAFPFTAGAVMARARAGLTVLGPIRVPQPKQDSAVLFRSIYNYAPLLEYDSQLHPGASGAALLNLDGELIGLSSTTAVVAGSEPGRGVALPIDENLTRLIEVLRRGGEIEYGFLGVTRPNFPQRGRGIPVEGAVSRGSPAAAAGLQHNDIITKINDVPVSSFEDLLLHIGHGLAGRPVTLTIQRSNKAPRDVTVTLAKFKNEMPYLASVKPEPVFGLRVEYSSVLTQTLVFNPFGGRNFVDVPPGVLIDELIPDSPAATRIKALGENARWIITHVNGVQTPTPADFARQAKDQKSIKLTLVDTLDGFGRTREVTLP